MERRKKGEQNVRAGCHRLPSASPSQTHPCDLAAADDYSLSGIQPTRRVHAKSLGRVQFCVTPWTVARQDPLSVGFSGQEYFSGFLCPPLGDLPHPGIESVSPVSPTLQADSLQLRHWGSPKETVGVGTKTRWKSWP